MITAQRFSKKTGLMFHDGETCVSALPPRASSQQLTLLPEDTLANLSVAGKRKGKKDDRHLWPFFKQIIAAKRPTWCLFENVAGHVTMGLDDVLSDLDILGYSAWSMLIPACAVNSKDRRGRVWILAHTFSNKLQRWSHETPTGRDKKTSPYQQLAGFLLTSDRASVSLARTYRSGHGVPNGTHRNKSLGNAVKPQMAYELGRAIIAAHYKEHQPCKN